MEKTRLLLGYAPEDYEVKKMPNNIMAHFSSEEQKISINYNIAKYDRNVIDYIALNIYYSTSFAERQRIAPQTGK